MAESIKRFSPGEHERGFLLGGGVRSVKSVCLTLASEFVLYQTRACVPVCVYVDVCVY